MNSTKRKKELEVITHIAVAHPPNPCWFGLKKTTPISAGRPVCAGWLNPSARPYFKGPSSGDPSTDSDIGIVDSGCSRSMTGNKEKLDDFVQIKGGIVKFGGGDGRISGKGTIRTSKLDFENVYYVEELQHFNLFSVSQICDKKNKVLFTDTDCLVLSEEFQLPDESQVVLRIPREHDLYTFSISDLQPEQKVTCLVAKASLDESTRWHRRMAHVNFKTINKLAKEGLVDGLPLKVLWIQNQMLDYGFNFMNTKIFIDNQSTICIVKNPVFHQRTKHIEIRHHFIRDANEKNLIQVLKIHTDDNVADLLTKAFDGPRFEYLVVHIGMLSFLLDALFLLLAMDYAADSVNMLVGILLLVDPFLLTGAGGIMFLLADLFLLVVTSFYCAQLKTNSTNGRPSSTPSDDHTSENLGLLGRVEKRFRGRHSISQLFGSYSLSLIWTEPIGHFASYSGKMSFLMRYYVWAGEGNTWTPPMLAMAAAGDAADEENAAAI
ncbi:ribonuclease H-like domain-containing protein [Tanacetum coccineum]